MKRRGLIAALLVAAGVLIWALLPTSAPEARQLAPKPPAPAIEPEPEAEAAPDPFFARDLPAAPKPAEDDETAEAPSVPHKLDKKSEAFIERVDDVIPDRIYGAAAEECWERGLPEHQKIRMKMRIHAVNGEVFVTGVEVLKNTIENQKMAECIQRTVANVRWRDDEMPDWEDEDELMIRIGGMKKHLNLPDDSENEGARLPGLGANDPDAEDLAEFERRGKK